MSQHQDYEERERANAEYAAWQERAERFEVYEPTPEVAMKWTDDAAEPRPRKARLDTSIDFTISVSDDGETRWQYFMLSFGTHSEEPSTVCLETWPREAIAEARRRLDELEAKLAEVDYE